MRRISLLALLLIMVWFLPALAKSRAAQNRQGNGAVSEQEVLRDFEQILELWREGRYDELFERSTGGSVGKESFAAKLASAPRRPACCWEKMQEAKVSFQGDQALVQARLGFEGSVSGTEFVTRGIRLRKEEGVWVISRSDLLSLAKASKKRSVYKYLPIQGK